jgi:hypothetical protein
MATGCCCSIGDKTFRSLRRLNRYWLLSRVSSGACFGPVTIRIMAAPESSIRALNEGGGFRGATVTLFSAERTAR